jgi:hypothetical protein
MLGYFSKHQVTIVAQAFVVVIKLVQQYPCSFEGSLSMAFTTTPDHIYFDLVQIHLHQVV